MTVDVGVVGRRVRQLRRTAGLSQAELADRAGVSRQAVGALELGRHLPRVDAAVGLARALGTTVEDLLTSDQSAQALHVLGGDLPDGRPVRAAAVGDRTVVIPLPLAADGEIWPAPDALVRDGQVALLDGADLDGFVIAGCDPALGVLAALAPARGPGRLLPVVTSSAAARHALTLGRVHAAVVHDVSPSSPGRPGSIHRIRLSTWRTGLAAPPDRREALVDALEGRGHVVQREDGAAAQAAYERALAAGGHVPPDGPRASGHGEAARRAAEHGTAAVTIEPVAAALGLAFHALETHTVEMWVAAHAAGHPGRRALGELLASARLRTRLAVLPGYDMVAAA